MAEEQIEQRRTLGEFLACSVGLHEWKHAETYYEDVGELWSAATYKYKCSRQNCCATKFGGQRPLAPLPAYSTDSY